MASTSGEGRKHLTKVESNKNNDQVSIFCIASKFLYQVNSYFFSSLLYFLFSAGGHLRYAEIIIQVSKLNGSASKILENV